MSRDDQQCLNLGRMVVRMIRDLESIREAKDCGYARRHVTYPGGSVEVIVATKDVADLLDEKASKKFAVEHATPPSEVN